MSRPILLCLIKGMDANKVEDRRDLMTAVEHSRWKLEDVRVSRRKLLKRTAGSEWYPNGADDRTPINQIAQAEGTLVQHLIGGEPRALVVPGSSGLEALAYEQTLALNKVSQQVGLRRKLRRLVRDAIYGIGICRIGMTMDRAVSLREIAPDLDEEGEVGVGRLTFEVISLENWVHDCMADTLEELEFSGHSYWVREQDLESHLPGVSPKDLIDEEKRWIDEQGGEMAGAISRDTDGEGQSRGYGKRYWLWDLWLPKEGMLVTTQVNGTGEIAHVRKWDSRPGGPYMFLWYREVSDQAMPNSVLADLVPVHDSLNSTFRKLIDQTKDQKTVLGFKPGHEDDAQRILDASSRAAIQMRDPSAVQEFNFNGPDKSLLAMFIQTREIASILGGNTDVLAGLRTQAPTLGQEQMIGEQASARVQSMEVDTAVFVVEVFEAMRWYLYNEQVEPILIVKEVPGTDLRIASEFSSMRAEGARFDAFQMQIEPYSLTYRSPEQRLQSLLQWWGQVILPAMQMGLLQQAPDFERLNEIAAQYLNLPEIRSILRQMSPDELAQMAAGVGGGDGPRKPPTSTRHYVRHGAPGPPRGGAGAQAMQMMDSGE